MRLLLVITLLFPAALAAQAKRSAAPKWTGIGKTSQGNAVFVDARSVKREQGIVTAALRTVFTPPVKSRTGDITSSRTVAMFDCAKRRYAVKEVWMYHDEKKGTVFEHRAPKIPGYGTPFKGSLSELALNHLCKS